MSPIISTMRNFPYPKGYTGPSAAKSPPGQFDRLMQDFKEAAAQTPAERARAEVLKRHQLDGDSFASLPPGRKAQIEAEIADAVRRTFKRVEHS